MTALTSYFVVEFETEDGKIEPYFYYGPAMDIEEWAAFITAIRKESIKQIKKEKSTLNPATVKFRIDRILKERGFFKHTINVAIAELNTEENIKLPVQNQIRTRASNLVTAATNKPKTQRQKVKVS